MDWLWELLSTWLGFGADARTRTADAAERYLLPILLLVIVGCLVVLIVWAASR